MEFVYGGQFCKFITKLIFGTIISPVISSKKVSFSVIDVLVFVGS